MNPSQINPHCGAMTVPPLIPEKIPAAFVALQRTLQRGGWTVETIELDLHNDTARAEFRRFDGLHVTLDARNGRTSITREMVTERAPSGSRYGGGLRTEFLGRTRCEGPRDGLRRLANYLADNATQPILRNEVRSALALCMTP